MCKTCKAALGEFQELSRELSSLHTILHELEDEAKIPTSLLNRRGSDRKPELDRLLTNLSTTLKQIEDIVERYHSLGRDQKKTWDRVKFATKDLAELRSKVQSHINGINLFISNSSHSTPISDLNTTVYTRTTIARGQLLEVENFTLAERQNLVSMVTKPYGGSGRSAFVRTEIAKAQTIVNQIAFRTEKFNYEAYGKLGHATTSTRTLHVTGVFRASKPSANRTALVASVNFALNALKPEHIYDYIEVPSGFRCTRRALVGFPEFFIMIVKLPLVRRYGIIF